MQKKLTISIDEAVYAALYRNVGPGKISRFISDSIRPRLKLTSSIRDGYRRMGKDKEWMNQAEAWVESHVDDGLPEESETKWKK